MRKISQEQGVSCEGNSFVVLHVGLFGFFSMLFFRGFMKMHCKRYLKF